MENPIYIPSSVRQRKLIENVVKELPFDITDDESDLRGLPTVYALPGRISATGRQYINEIRLVAGSPVPYLTNFSDPSLRLPLYLPWDYMLSFGYKDRWFLHMRIETFIEKYPNLEQEYRECLEHFFQPENWRYSAPVEKILEIKKKKKEGLI